MIGMTLDNLTIHYHTDLWTYHFMNLQFILILAMQFKDELSCNICLRLPKQALQCSQKRCAKLICNECHIVLKQQCKKENREYKCPFCRVVPFFVEHSEYQNEINKQRVKCKHCKKDCEFQNIESHQASCDEKMVKCQFCHTKEYRKNIVRHTQNFHEDKISFIRQTCYTVRPPIYDPKKIFELRGNKQTSSPQLGTNGKFYCNGPLGEPSCNCCGERCGPYSGENCINCMKLDTVRRGLTRGYLVNSNGEVCWKDNKDNFTCGTLYSAKRLRCEKEEYCNQCKHLQKSQQRYRQLFMMN